MELKCVHFLFLLSSHNFPQKMQSKNLLSDLGSGTLSIHVLFVCIVIFIFSRSSDIPRVGLVEAASVEAQPLAGAVSFYFYISLNYDPPRPGT